MTSERLRDMARTIDTCRRVLLSPAEHAILAQCALKWNCTVDRAASRIAQRFAETDAAIPELPSTRRSLRTRLVQPCMKAQQLQIIKNRADEAGLGITQALRAIITCRGHFSVTALD